MKKYYFLIFIALLAGMLAGCSSQGKTLKGEDADAVLAYSEAKTDNLLAGMNANDYDMFSEDFDEAMLKAMSKVEFVKLKGDRDAKLGQYVSRQVNSVVQVGEFYAVNYDAVFEKEKSVVVRVVFRAAEPHEVSGLWFNK